MVDVVQGEKSGSSDDNYPIRGINKMDKLQGGMSEIIENIKKEEERKKQIEKIENDIIKNNFDNCNTYLKNPNPSNDNRPRRSALNFIKDTEMNGITNSIKSTKDPLADKEYVNNTKKDIFNTNKKEFGEKIEKNVTLININNKDSNLMSDKKSEYQSRRGKNQFNNILNELDNPKGMLENPKKVIDLNINSTGNNRGDIDNKISRKNHGSAIPIPSNNFNFNSKIEIGSNIQSKDMIIGESYKRGGNGSNSNNGIGNLNLNGLSGSTGTGLFESRRHVVNNNTNSVNNHNSKSKESNINSKDKKNFLII